MRTAFRLTLTLQKSRMLLARSRSCGEIQGVTHEVVANYREPIPANVLQGGLTIRQADKRRLKIP